MKKKSIVIAVIVVVVVGVWFITRPQTDKEINNSNNGLSINFNGGYYGEEASDIQVTSKGIVYTGKVVPEQIYYYQKDATKQFNKLYVNEGQMIEENELLFDYLGQGLVNDKITVLEQSFVNLQNQKDDLYARLAENQEYLTEEKKYEGDKGYIAYLETEIASLNSQIAQNNIDWKTAEMEISSLKQSVSEYKVRSEVAGLVYQINDSIGVAPGEAAKTAYMVVYSDSRMIRISVSEYELSLVSEGMQVEVEVEGLKETFTGTIQFVDSMPNNLESEDTSYYYVEIAVPSSIPYGFSAIVTVPNHE